MKPHPQRPGPLDAAAGSLHRRAPARRQRPPTTPHSLAAGEHQRHYSHLILLAVPATGRTDGGQTTSTDPRSQRNRASRGAATEKPSSTPSSKTAYPTCVLPQSPSSQSAEPKPAAGHHQGPQGAVSCPISVETTAYMAPRVRRSRKSSSAPRCSRAVAGRRGQNCGLARHLQRKAARVGARSEDRIRDEGHEPVYSPYWTGTPRGSRRRGSAGRAATTPIARPPIPGKPLRSSCGSQPRIGKYRCRSPWPPAPTAESTALTVTGGGLVSTAIRPDAAASARCRSRARSAPRRPPKVASARSKGAATEVARDRDGSPRARGRERASIRRLRRGPVMARGCIASTSAEPLAFDSWRGRSRA